MNKHIERFERVFERFEQEHPLVVERLIDWYPSGRNEITIRTDNDQTLIYNYITNTLRNAYVSDDRVLDEFAWKTEFAKRLRNKMSFAGISHWELSELTGVSEVSISKYVNGKALPSAYNLSRIARVLKCSAGELTDI